VFYVRGLTTDEEASVIVELHTPGLTLIVRRLRKIVPPIKIEPWITVVDPDRFIDATLGELATYIAAKNHGSRHWIEDLLKEKLERLALCGIAVEILTVQ
jgi:hypothetical protein